MLNFGYRGSSEVVFMPVDFTGIMKHKTDYLSTQEIDRMLQFCYENMRIRDYLLLLTLQRTGRRVSEIVGMPPYTRAVGFRPIDINYDEGLIEFDILKKNHIKSKNKYGKKVGSERLEYLKIKKIPKRKLFPVDWEFLSIIKSYIQKEKISLRTRIFPMTRQRVDQIVKDVAHECGINRPSKKIHAHMFRHSMAINMLKDNPSNPYILIQVQELLDHSNLNITRTYTQFTPEDIRKSLNKLYIKGETNENTEE